MTLSLASAGPGVPESLAPYHHLTSVAAAVVCDDGRLLYCNGGFQRLLRMRGVERSANVADFFVTPSFQLLAAAPTPADQEIYRGLLNLGDAQCGCRTLTGTVHRDGPNLTLVAEFDVAEMEMGNAQIVQLNEQLVDAQRELARKERSLRLAKQTVEAQRDQMEARVIERTTDLALAKEKAEAASRVKSTFLANMSHEIRTPLNGVLGLAQIGFRDSADPARTHATFGRIIESGKLLLGVIDDILDFSKIEAGKLEVEQVAASPAEVIDRIVESSAERARAKGLSLIVEKAADLPAVCLTDPLRLQQIVLNLLSNAIKFTERGSVTIRAARQGVFLRIEVADTGIGMSHEQVERIFAPFEQADTSTTRRFGGTGLGLSITHRLVDLLGGEITVDSTLGIGSTFAVSLPYRAAPAAEGPGPEERQAVAEMPGQRLAGLSILVAEDNDINQLVIEELLASEGASVTMACNGSEALDCVRYRGAGAFDVVLMDIHMPQMDGYEATRQILAAAPTLPIVGQTAHAMAEERDKCLAAGMADHISKPIDPDELVAVVLRNVMAKTREPAP